MYISFVPTNILKIEHFHEFQSWVYVRTALWTIYRKVCSAHVSWMRPIERKWLYTARQNADSKQRRSHHKILSVCCSTAYTSEDIRTNEFLFYSWVSTGHWYVQLLYALFVLNIKTLLIIYFSSPRLGFKCAWAHNAHWIIRPCLNLLIHLVIYIYKHCTQEM